MSGAWEAKLDDVTEALGMRGPGVERVLGFCSEHGPYELPLGSIDSGEISRGCPGCNEPGRA